jgi:hypothetical protein
MPYAKPSRVAGYSPQNREREPRDPHELAWAPGASPVRRLQGDDRAVLSARPPAGWR